MDANTVGLVRPRTGAARDDPGIHRDRHPQEPRLRQEARGPGLLIGSSAHLAITHGGYILPPWPRLPEPSPPETVSACLMPLPTPPESRRKPKQSGVLRRRQAGPPRMTSGGIPPDSAPSGDCRAETGPADWPGIERYPPASPQGPVGSCRPSLFRRRAKPCRQKAAPYPAALSVGGPMGMCVAEGSSMDAWAIMGTEGSLGRVDGVCECMTSRIRRFYGGQKTGGFVSTIF